ncbi:MAG: ROK family protein [Parachlamydiaceae bacterium]|nr:ROK family protein [Parachlamydiaceae bacterium]
MTVASWTIGVDLGGTKLDVGMVDMSGKIVDRVLIKTRVKEGSKVVIQDIVAAIRALQAKNSEKVILSIGVGIAGQIDSKTGDVRFAPNLNWTDVPLQTELSKALKLPVYVLNDVRAATWGEWLYGAGKGSNDIICIFVGTGIGGGVISDGKMLLGCSNSAGEIGHITIDVNGPKCTCGNYGCFEALASGWAIARRAKESVVKHPDSGKPLLELVNGKIDDLSAKHVLELSHSGDLLARSIVQEVSVDLVAGIAGLVNAFNPQRVIMGGGIIYGYPEFIEEIRLGVSKRALKVAVEHLQIIQASLHADAGVIGAAAYARGVCNQGGNHG